VLVAERGDGHVVGYIDAHWFPNLLHGHEGYISELFIHPAETGRGIGGQLLAAIKECAIKRVYALCSLICAYGSHISEIFMPSMGGRSRKMLPILHSCCVQSSGKLAITSRKGDMHARITFLSAGFSFLREKYRY
jgi:GNAT superfamily N-acetyltransferase